VILYTLKRANVYMTSLTLTYKKYLLVLFSEAWNSSPLDFIYSILRVTGLHHGHWDPYVELNRAFTDYNQILEFANEQEGISSLRIAY